MSIIGMLVFKKPDVRLGQTQPTGIQVFTGDKYLG
jgi:hypothetical protein